ncbi:PEP-CTERM sorting domain-containing protein [Phycisphaerales bacterium AB-hyl4]|uniref:PEP-CTERM sorting domain-containing protein n=1 Tax=Natronomicrosphaera hydrolytica TaxID=3242702 RepID=A0ABV4U2Z3_9BACT
MKGLLSSWMSRGAAAAVVAVGMVAAPAVQAGTPASWSTGTLETSDEDVLWTSPTAVELGFPSYTYDYEITTLSVYADLTGTGLAFTWLSAINLGLVDSGDLVGGGTLAGLPGDIINQSFDAGSGGLSVVADVLIFVDENGYGQAELTNIQFGNAIQAVRFGADINMIPIPEPGTLGLLAVGGALAMLRRRPAQVCA